MTRRSVIVFSSGQSIKTLKLFSEVLPANFCLSRILTDLLKIFDVALLFFGEEFSLVSPDKQAHFFIYIIDTLLIFGIDRTPYRIILASYFKF